MKPINVIVLTDGNFSARSPRSCLRRTESCEAEEPHEIVAYIRPIIAQLKVLKNPEDLQRRVGIQLVQVGRDPGATASLQHLDDAFRQDEASTSRACCLSLRLLIPTQDIIDTTPWNEQLSPETLFKILLGAIHEKMDEATPVEPERVNTAIFAPPVPASAPAYPGHLA